MYLLSLLLLFQAQLQANDNKLLNNKVRCTSIVILVVIFSQQSWMIDAGQEKGKSLDHTKDKQLQGDYQDNAKCSGGFLFKSF